MAGAIEPSSDDLITEINITPMVDIMLVLLIIFMVTASVITKDSIIIDLPEAATSTETETTTLGLTLDADGELYLNGEPIAEERLRAFIRAEVGSEQKVQAVIAADRSVTHGAVIQLIDLVKQEGVHSFAINVDPPSIPGASSAQEAPPDSTDQDEAPQASP